MKFGPVAVADAEGAILAHSVRHAGGVLKKGTVLTAADVAALTEANVATVVAARLEPSDVHEDEAAVRLARALAGNGVRVERPFTGRSNLYAERAGVLVVNRQRIHQLNRIDPAITIATLPEYAVVGSRANDRDGEDHPVRGGWGEPCRRRGVCRRRDPRRAVPAAQGRACRDIASLAQAVGDGQDPAAARGAAGAGRRAPGPRDQGRA